MTKNTYRLLDVFIFTIIASAIEAINVTIFNVFKVSLGKYTFNQLYTLSFAVLLGIIATYRWNQYGLIVAPVAGFVSVFTRSALNQTVTMQLYLSQSIGNLGIAIGLLFFLKIDKKKMRESLGKMYLYYFACYFTVEILRSLCQIGQADYWYLLLNTFAFDLINIVFGAIVYLIALKQKDFVTDMNTYLSEMNDLKSKLSGQMSISKNDSISVEEITDRNDTVNEAALLDGGVLSTSDLKQLQDNRRKFENKTTFFDKENEELKKYRLDKEAKKHGSK